MQRFGRAKPLYFVVLPPCERTDDPSSTETPPGSTVLEAIVQCNEYMIGEENAPAHQITFIFMNAE